jgi:hypothetical protein
MADRQQNPVGAARGVKACEGMIASLEVFLSMLLSVVVFRSERLAGAAGLGAAALATFGLVLRAA